MTFTLFGRWQIRILLLATVGLLLSAIVMIKSGTQGGGNAVLTVIYLGVFGIFWDGIYHQLQRLRWDGDWGGVLQLLGAIGEGVFFILVAKYLGLPGIDRDKFNMFNFISFDAILCMVSYAIANSVLRIISPYSRFRGGQWF
jgi:hypothetical protein